MKKLLAPTLTSLFVICLSSTGIAQSTKERSLPASTTNKVNTPGQVSTEPLENDSISPKAFIIDLGTPKLKNKKHKKYTLLQADTRELISFQLINGNPFKYNYVINSNTVNLFENSTTDPFADQLKKIDDATNAGEKTEEAKAASAPEDIQAAKKKIAESEDKIADLTAAKAAVSQSNGKKINRNSRVVENLSKQINKLKANLTSDRSDLAATKQRIKENYRQATDYINTSIYSDTLFAESVRRLKIASVVSTGDEKNSKDAFITNARIMLQTTTEALYDINGYKLYIVHEDFLDTNYTNHKKDFYNQLLQLNKKFGDLTNSIQNANIKDTNLDAIVKKIDGNLGEIKATYATLANVQMNYYTLPHDINGKNIDLLRMTVERRDKVTNALLSKNDYQIWIKGGLKIDISAGVFLSSLKDDKYFTIDVPGATPADASTKAIYLSNQGKYGLGFGSMLNISYRTGSAWLKPALSVGAMVSEAQKFQGLAGLGLTLGKEERAVLHWGLSFGSITKLENSYKTFDNGGKTYSLGQSNQVPTAQRFTFGHFFGFTYNITGTKAKAPSVAPANGQ